jgi:aromatic-L-amino-acid/L-tryptophan decarboxylase
VTTELHQLDPDLARRCLGWLVDRLTNPAPLGGVALPSKLNAALGSTSLTADGLGLDEAWRRFADVLAPATAGLASERFLAFIPAAPSAAAVLMDAVVAAASFSGESWLEAAGAIHAENEVLAWLAALAGLPQGAAGCFVSGGSSGNLSALAVARDHRRGRPVVAVADTAHSSVSNALHLLGMEALVVPTGADGRLNGSALAATIDGRADVGVVVASAGSTNAGVIDDLAGIAEVCGRTGAWLHVDGAYGGAGLLVDSLRPKYSGLERADSFIVDPHKWLFSTLGSCALLYRDPSQARTVHTQHAAYLDSFHSDEEVLNPADHAFHLTRRAAGLPIWFSLAVHGVDAHAAAVNRGIELAHIAARRIESMGASVELIMEPDLSVVLFRRRGWGDDDWWAWSRQLLADGVAFVTPTVWLGETVGRLVFLHPSTDESVIDETLARLS